MVKRTNAERRIQQQLANLTVMDIREAFYRLPNGLLFCFRHASAACVG